MEGGGPPISAQGGRGGGGRGRGRRNRNRGGGGAPNPSAADGAAVPQSGAFLGGGGQRQVTINRDGDSGGGRRGRGGRGGGNRAQGAPPPNLNGLGPNPEDDQHGAPAGQAAGQQNRGSVFSRLGPRTGSTQPDELPIQQEQTFPDNRRRRRSPSPYGGPQGEPAKRARYSPPPRYDPHNPNPASYEMGTTPPSNYRRGVPPIDTHRGQQQPSPRLHTPSISLPPTPADVGGGGLDMGGDEMTFLRNRGGRVADVAYRDRDPYGTASDPYAAPAPAGPVSAGYGASAHYEEYDHRDSYDRRDDYNRRVEYDSRAPAPARPAPERRRSPMRIDLATLRQQRLNASLETRGVEADRRQSIDPRDHQYELDRGRAPVQAATLGAGPGHRGRSPPRGRSRTPPYQQSRSMAAQQPPPAQQPRAAPALPYPWKRYEAPDGKPYYHNPETGVTTWDPPPAPAPAPAPRAPIDRDRDARSLRQPLERGGPVDRDRPPMDRDRIPLDRERMLVDRDLRGGPMERERQLIDRDRMPLERERLPLERERGVPERAPLERDRTLDRERERAYERAPVQDRYDRPAFQQQPQRMSSYERGYDRGGFDEGEEGEIVDSEPKLRQARAQQQQMLQQQARGRAPLPPQQVPSGWRGGPGVIPGASPASMARQPGPAQMLQGPPLRGPAGPGGQQGPRPTKQDRRQERRDRQQQSVQQKVTKLDRGRDGWAENQARYEEQQKAQKPDGGEIRTEVAEEEEEDQEQIGMDTEELAAMDPRDILGRLLAANRPQPTLRSRLRALAPLLPRRSTALRAIRKLGVLRDPPQRETVVVLDAETEWELRRRIAGSRRLGRVEFTGMAPSWSVLIEDAVEPPKLPADLPDAIKEEAKRLASRLPEGCYRTSDGWIAKKVIGTAGTAKEDPVSAMEVVA